MKENNNTSSESMKPLSAKEKLRLRIQQMTSPVNDLPLTGSNQDNSNTEMSFAQNGLWFMNQLVGANAVYNLPVV